MASEDFIDLDSDPGNDADELGNQAPEPIEVHHIRGDPGVDGAEEAGTRDGESDQETILHKEAEWEETVAVVEEVAVAGPGPMENGSMATGPPSRHGTEPSCILLSCGAV